jgi:hypothetical protein
VWDNGEYHCFCIGDLCNRRLERTVDAAPPTCFDLIRNALMGPLGLLLMAIALMALIALLIALFHSCPKPEPLTMRECREKVKERLAEKKRKQKLAAQKSAEKGGGWTFCD